MIVASLGILLSKASQIRCVIRYINVLITEIWTYILIKFKIFNKCQQNNNKGVTPYTE